MWAQSVLGFFSFSQRGSSLMGQHIRSVYSAKLSTSVLTQYFYGGRGFEEVFICNFSTFSKTNLCIYLWIWTEICVGVCEREKKSEQIWPVVGNKMYPNELTRNVFHCFV